MPDETIVCKDCETPFVFAERDQEFYQRKGYTPPKRCKSCREAKKERQAAGGARERR